VLRNSEMEPLQAMKACRYISTHS